VRSYFGDRVYEAIIPRSVRLAEAPGFGKPITRYDPTSKGALAYRKLAREVLNGRGGHAADAGPQDQGRPAEDAVTAAPVEMVEGLPSEGPPEASGFRGHDGREGWGVRPVSTEPPGHEIGGEGEEEGWRGLDAARRDSPTPREGDSPQ